MRARRLFLAAVVVVLSSREAAGETWHLKSPSEVVTEKGSKVALPPGYFLDEKSWQERDAELKAAQAERTRLKAENDSLRKSASDSSPWLAGTVVLSLITGIVYSIVK